MRVLKTAMFVLAGAASGIAFVLACGDDTVQDVDAQECDCPTPQPIEERIRTVSEEETLDAEEEAGAVAADCATLSEAAVLLGAICSAGTSPVYLSSTNRGGGGSTGFSCIWQNPNGSGGVTLTATAICLVPEGTP